MVTSERTILTVEGMTCSACVSRVERTLQRSPGVNRASVNLMTGTAVVEFQNGTTTPDQLGEKVSALGYPSRPRQALHRSNPPPPSRSHQIAAAGSLAVFALAMILGAPLMHIHDASTDLLALIAMPFHGLLRRAVPSLWEVSPAILGWILLVVHLPVLLIWGRHFFVATWKAARSGAADMNTLVAAGTGSAFLLSLPSVFAPHWLHAHGLPAPLWFESVSGVIGFVSLGKWLEHKARARTNRSIEELVQLLPDQARLIDADTERLVPPATLLPGDTVLVRVGERVPADGKAISEGLVEESHLTGESIPRQLGEDDEVQAGSLVLRQPLRLRVERSGEGTTVERIAGLIEQAQSSKAPLQKTADRIAEIFAPTVLVLAALTLVLWLAFGGSWVTALTASISLLVAACPCAMGLAVPSALAVALGRAAKLGLVVRDAAALETLGRATSIVFDKTGTLTEGRPLLVRTVVGNAPSEPRTREELLLWVALVETDSIHPLAGPILDAARDLPRTSTLPTPSGPSNTLAGQGVELPTDRGLLRAGRGDWVVEDASGLPSDDPGETLVHLSLDGIWLGSLGLSDPARSDAAVLVEALHERGIKVELLSGDGQGAVQALADQLGIDVWKARATPEDKAARIAESRARGEVVVMVGDGINDAAALAAADAGIALESGTAVAFECASAVVRSPITLLDAIDLGRATVRTVRGNLGWAFGYNIVLLPVAAGILHPFGGPMLSPVLAGAAMSLSSVSVMLHSLRLLGFRGARKAASSRVGSDPVPMPGGDR